MSRKPADYTPANARMGHGQQAVWDEIRRLRDGAEGFTVADIGGVVEMHPTSIRDYLSRLVAAGYLKRISAGGLFTTDHYMLIRDGGVHAPRLRRDGSAVTQGAGTRCMWTSMRHLPNFDAAELVAHAPEGDASVSLATAKSYCTALLRAGYLRVVQKANPAQHRLARYRLVRNTGPQPPQVQRVKQVFDANLGRVMTPEDRG